MLNTAGDIDLYLYRPDSVNVVLAALFAPVEACINYLQAKSVCDYEHAQ